MRKFASILLVLALLGACSDGGAADVASGPSPAQDTADARPPADRSPDAREGTEDEPDGGPAGSAGEEPGDRSDARADMQPPDPGREDGGGVFNDGEGEDDHSSALHPAAGRYVYSQSGFERFCQTATCDERPLPPRQPVGVTLRGRGDTTAVVVSEARSSDSRTVTTTTVYSRRNAVVTDVYARFAYEGFTFENSYTPRPPVETLRFPLKPGKSWSGRWNDSTSGDYSINVLGRDTVEVNGAVITAFKLSMVTRFRGEFTGTSKALLWIDVATKSMVKTSGAIDLRSSFGRYVSEFNNTLRSGPGYR